MQSGDDAAEQSLIDAARQGDREAFDQLLRRHQPMIWALCRRIVGDDHQAADAAQEAMISIVKNLARFDGRSSLRTWIYRVATNAALDEVRRRGRRPQLLNDDEILRRAAVVTHGGDAVDDRMVVEAVLAQLPADFRAAVVLRDVVDLDYAHIAEVLNVPPGTVRSRIARGRRLLAASLGAYDGNPRPDGERPNDDPGSTGSMS
jgi:RNA polymerase sigma-70 factor (ECF subfamily)